MGIDDIRMGVLPEDLHGLMVAAESGDQSAHDKLATLYAPLMEAALAGSRSASFALCRMADWGLGMERNPAECWAWVRWAHDGCALENEPDVDDEVTRAFRFFLILDNEIRGRGERWLDAMLTQQGIRNREIRPILRAGVCGGDCHLYGSWHPEGWYFFQEPEAWASEVAGKAHLPEWSQPTTSWRRALSLLDLQEWHRFIPFEIHPEFAERLWRARQRRWAKCPEGDDRYRNRWREACGLAE